MGDFRAKFSSQGNSSFGASFTSGGAVIPSSSPSTSANDHARLINRNANDQHPMSAITGLVEALAAVPTSALTNLEIQIIMTEG